METKSAKHAAKLLNSSSLCRPLMILSAASVLFGANSAQALDSGALPQDPNVVGGQATFSQGKNTLNVNQTSNRAVIDWRSFNIGSAAQTNFNQLSSKSIAVNRVNGSADPTQIEGGLHANGQVWILNPNGVFFGKGARVDAAGVVATTGNINDKAFMAGSNKLQFTGADHGSVSNAGNITVGQAGLAAFVAPSVSNSGTINATVGKVALAAGTTFTLDLAGDHLVELGLGGVNAVVDNSGRVVNPGGTIALTAKAAGQVVNSVVNVSGVVSASSVTKSGGSIVLGADNVTTTSTAQVTADAGTNGNGGTITSVANNQGNYAGAFSAKGGSASGNGGQIETSGKNVNVASTATISASATNGNAGKWTIDPINVTISTGTGGGLTGATVTTGKIQDTLAGGTSVDIKTSQSDNGGDLGDLTLAGSISATSTNNAGLTLEGRHLSATGGSTISIAGGALTLDVNTIDTLVDTTGQSTNWVSDALGMVGTVSGGTTINLGAASYAGGAKITASGVTLNGLSGAKILSLTNGVDGVEVFGNNDTIQNLEFAGPADQSYLTYNWGSVVTRGVVIENGAQNFTITGNNIHGERNDILVDGRNTGSITNNVIDNSKSGISVQYTDGTTYESLDGSGPRVINITGNTQGQYGNEWGINYHLNGFWNNNPGDDSHPSPNPVVTGVYIANAPTAALQQEMLAQSAANGGMTIQDQAYKSSNRTAVTVATTGTATNQGSPLNALSTIQAGIDAVVTGGTVNVMDGIYVIPAGGANYIEIQKALTLKGQSENGTIIDARNASTYGMRVQADNVSLSDFTVEAPTATGSYGIKVEPLANVTPIDPNNRLRNFSITDVTSRGAGKTELDLNGVLGATINGFTANGAPVGNPTGSTAGNGIALTDSANVTITNSLTENNQWGGLALYQTNNTYNQQTNNITVDGSNTFTEANGIYAQDQSASKDFGSINLTGQGIQYIAQDATGNSDGNYTWFQKTEAGAITIAANSETLSGATVQGYTGPGVGGNNTFYVGTNNGHAMSIQTAVNAATNGANIDVLAGTYTGQVIVDDKTLTLTGAGAGTTFIDSPDTLASYTPTGTSSAKTAIVSIQDGADVTISGVTVDGLGKGNGRSSFDGIGVFNADADISSVDVTRVRDGGVSGTLTGAQHGIGVDVFNGDGTTRNVSLTGSTIEDFQKNATSFDGGNLTVDIEHNTITGSGPVALGGPAQNGIQLFGTTGVGNGIVTGTIADNTVKSIDYAPGTYSAAGILLINAAHTTVTNNTVMSAGRDTGSAGIFVEDSAGVSLTGNTVENVGYGITLFGSAGATITNGSVLGTLGGVYADATSTGLTVSGVNFSDNSYHFHGSATQASQVLANNTFDSTAINADAGDTIYGKLQTAVDDEAAGSMLDLNGTFVEQVNIDKDMTLVGSGTGTTTIEAPDTLATSFTPTGGSAQKAIVAITGSATVNISDLTVDGLGKGDINGNNAFDGIGIYNANATIDGVNITRVRDGGLSGSLTGIQDGVGVNVYNDDSVSRTVTLENSSIEDFQKNAVAFHGGNLTADVLNNTITGAGSTGLTAQNGVEFFGTAGVGNGTVTGTISGNTISGVSYNQNNNSSTDILLIDASGTTVSGNTVTGAGTGDSSNGFYASGSTGVSVTGNKFSNLGWGVDIGDSYGTAGVTITNNVISGNGVGVDVGDDATDASTVNVHNNSITGNTNAVELDTTHATTDFTNNWWGTANATTIANAMTGTAVGNINFSTYLASGTDTSATPGFQGDFSTIDVTALGAGTNRIANAVTAVTAGGTVNVGAGSFTLGGELDIAKSLTLSGAGAGTIITSNSTGYGMFVTADNTTLKGFTFNGPTVAGSTYGIKVEPGTNVASDRVTGFDIENVTINGGYRTGLDLNGVNGATINNVSVSNIVHGNGIALTDSANVTLTDDTTTNNAWGGLALYQTNTFYDQQVTGISVDGSNTFHEANGIYAQDQSATKNFGTINLTGQGIQYVAQDATGNADGNYTWFQKTLNGAIAFAANSETLSGATVQGYTGPGVGGNNTFYVGTDSGHAMSIATAVAAANTGATVNVQAGTYTLANELDITKSLTLAGAGASTIITSNSTGYGINVTADNTTLSSFTFNAPTAVSGTTYGIKVTPDTNVASDRLQNFDIDHVTINGGYRTGLDLNGVNGATIDNVSVSNVVHGNGIALTDSANVTLTNDTTTNNAWGGLALYQTNNFYNQQLSNITVDATNTFNETNGIYEEDQSALFDMGANVKLAGYNFVAADNTSVPTDTYMFFQKTQQNALDMATNAALNGGHLGLANTFVEGWTDSGLNNLFTVGTGSGGELTIQAAVNAATSGGTINVLDGTYAENVSDAKQLGFDFGNVGVTSFTLNTGAAGSSLSGNLSATGAITSNVADSLSGTFTAGSIALNGATTLAGDTTLDTSAANGAITTAAIDGAHDLTVNAGTDTASLGNLGATTRLGAFVDNSATTLTGGTYDAASIALNGATTLTADTTLDATTSVTTGSVDGAHDLTINADTATLGSLGASTRLGAVIDNSKSTQISGANDAASFDFVNAVTLTGDTTLDATSSVTMGSVDGAHALTIDAVSASLGNLGAATRLGAVTDNAVTTLTGGTYDAASLDFDAVTLTADTTLDATGSVTTGSVDGAHDLTINGATASLGNLGATTRLGAVTDNAATTLTSGTYDAASLDFADALTLTADTTLDATGSVTTASVDGAHDLTINGASASLGNLGATTRLGALTDNAATTLTGSTYDAASIALNGATTLTADTTLDATTSVTTGSVDGAHNLTINGASASLGSLGATTRLGAVTDNAATTLTGHTYDAASLDFDALTLAVNATLDATGSVTAASIDGAQALTINGASASLGNLGATTRLGAVTDNAETTLTGGTYDAASLDFGDVTLTADTTLDATSSVTTGSVDGAHNLTINGASASLGNLGATTRLGTVTDNAATTLTGGTYDAASLDFADGLTLTADTTLDATGSVTTASVDGAHDLTINGASASLGNLGATTRLGALTDNAATTLTGSTYDAASLDFADAVTLTADTTLDATGSVTTASVDGADALTINGATASLGNLGATTRLGAVTDNAATTLTGSTYDAASIALNGATTLTADTTLDATGSVTTASIDGAHDLTINGASASLGNLGATTRLGAVTDNAATTLTGSTYDAASLDFADALTLTADTTLDATTSVTTGSVDGAHALTINGASASLGDLGATTRLGAVTDNAATTLTGGTYDAASLDFDALTLTADTTLDATGSVTTGPVDGAHDLTINGASASFGNLGATTRLGALTDNAAATTLTGSTYDAASIALNGATTLTADTTLDAIGSVTTGSIDGAHNLVINGASASLGNLGATTRLGAVTDNAATTLIGGTYNAASLDFADGLTLTVNTTLDATGSVTTASIDGAHDLTINGASASLGNLGATTRLGALTDNAATTLTGGTYDAASLDFDALTLTADTTLDATGSVTTGSVDGAHNLTINGASASLGNLGATTRLGTVTDNAATTLTGSTYDAASLDFADGLTLTADTTLDATGSVTTASVDGAHDLTINGASASLGNLGATTRLGAVTDNAVTTLTGGTYDAASFDFGDDVTLTTATTTLNTTQSSSAAGDITFGGDIFGTTAGAQSLVLIAGPGTGAASANGDISLQNAGTLASRLDNMTVSGNNFTALTVDLAGDYNSTLTGNQVFAADTLNVLGSATSNVGGNASGHVVAQGDVTFNVGGTLSGTINGQNVNIQSGSVTNADITGVQSIGLQTGSISTTTLTAPNVNVDATTIDATVSASDTGTIKANTISGTYTGGDISLQASKNVDATVNSTDLSVLAPVGSVSGSWTNLTTDGSGTLTINGETSVGTGSTNPNQLIVEGFLLPAGTSITASGELVLPEGVVLGLLSPGGEKKPKVILVHSVRQLGELLAAGYTAIVIDITGQTKSLPTKLALN